MGSRSLVRARQPETGAPQAAPRVAQKINREIVLLLGWGPAILCQFAHPMVAAGVAEHSSFRASPRERARRLRSTVNSMLALTFGTPEEIERAARGIRAIHDRVHGKLEEGAGPFPLGAAYSAHDPELLRWVHATMLDLLPRTYELYVGPLTNREKDRYCQEASGVAPLLGVPGNYLPASAAELRGYLDGMLASGEIAVSPTARALAHDLINPPFPEALRPLSALSRLPTVGLLSPAIRAAYGFPWSSRQERALRITATLIRSFLRLAPAPLKHWPAARRAARRGAGFRAEDSLVQA